jgi:hypothetical protein
METVPAQGAPAKHLRSAGPPGSANRKNKFARFCIKAAGLRVRGSASKNIQCYPSSVTFSRQLFFFQGCAFPRALGRTFKYFKAQDFEMGAILVTGLQ